MITLNQYITEQEKISRPPGLVDVKRYGFVLNMEEVEFFGEKGIFLQRNAAEALKRAKKMMPPGYNFVINSGYRGYESQYKINEYMKEKLKKQYPNNWQEKLDMYTGGEDYLEYLRTHKGKFVYMSHASGNAVDIVGIIDNRKKPLDFGGQTNTKTDELNYYEKKRSLTPKEKIIKKNRQLLNDVLTKNHFDVNKDEWWHWGVL